MQARSAPLLAKRLVPVLALAGATVAAPPPPAGPGPLTDMLGCRSIGEAGARLACYDAKGATLAAAQEHQDIVVMDRAAVRKTRRSLFGLSLPNLDLFGGRDKSAKSAAADDFDQLTDVVKEARQNAYGQWIVILGDGARWTQTDTQTLNIDPKPGMPITIRRAAMGSYLAKLGGQTAIRMTRSL